MLGIEALKKKQADLSACHSKGINSLDDWIVKEVIPQIMAMEMGESRERLKKKFDWHYMSKIKQRINFNTRLFCGKRPKTKEMTGVKMLQDICRDKNFELDLHFCDGSPFYKDQQDPPCAEYEMRIRGRDFYDFKIIYGSIRREEMIDHWAQISIYYYPLGSSEWKDINENWYCGGGPPRSTGFNILCGILAFLTIGAMLGGIAEIATWFIKTS